MNNDERCAEAKRVQQIEAAFRAGDLGALRVAVEEPSVIPNGPMPLGIGNCLVFAIYRSPLAFIRELLDIGADPNAPADDGFPPLIAALSCSRNADGAPKRGDVDGIIQLLLARGADPNQRGLNDWTPLHMAVAERNLLAVHRLLEGGADPHLPTRIDDCDTPLEMAEASGLPDFADVLRREGRPVGERLRSGLTLLADVPGTGDLVRRQHNYMIRLRLWLHRGDAVRWPTPWGPAGIARLEDDGTTLVTEVRVNRGQLMNGLFYGMDGMRVGGTRRLEIAPHLAYAERGVPGAIPENALLTAEITILEQAQA
jgi:hypothetical protein